MEELFGLLYARPTFAQGFGQLFDFGQTTAQYNLSASGHEADYYALREDWRAVARDMGIAFDECIHREKSTPRKRMPKA